MASEPLPLLCPLRAGKDYTGHKFTFREKLALIDYLAASGTSTSSLVGSIRGLGERTVNRWKQLHRSGILMDRPDGRPPNIDEIGMESYIQELSGHLKKSKYKSGQIYLRIAAETSLRRNKLPNLDLASSGSSFDRYFNKMNCKLVSPQRKTNARINAEADPRNVFTWAVGLHAFADHKVPHMIFNWDATTFLCGDEDYNDEKVIITALSRQQALDAEQARSATVESTGQMGLFIKKIHHHNAAGKIAPPVFVFQDPDMIEDTFEVHMVNDLSSSPSTGAVGFVVFSPTRGCSTEFYKWYVTTISVPFILSNRQDCNAKVCSI